MNTHQVQTGTGGSCNSKGRSGVVKKLKKIQINLKQKKASVDNASAIAIWSEDIVLNPGNVRHPIRVVMVDNEFVTRFDRLVSLPKNCTTYIYRVLDHGIPWQHLDSGSSLEDVKQKIIDLAKGKRLVVFDAWKTVGLFEFTEQQLSRLKIYDLKSSSKSKRPDGEPWSFWELVNEKLGHAYTGKPGNYDAVCPYPINYYRFHYEDLSQVHHMKSQMKDYKVRKKPTKQITETESK